MNKYSLYVSDDALPVLSGGIVRNEDILEHPALRHLIDDAKIQWPEPEVRDLLDKVTAANTEWNVRAARNPEFFLKEFDNRLIRPDVVVFDWDYAGQQNSTDQYLLDILGRTYCIVQIYTGADKLEEISALLATEKFLPFKSRLDVKEKSKVDSAELLKSVEEKRKRNFSYAFGSKLRTTTLNSVEEILVSLGKNSIDHVMGVLSTQGTTEIEFRDLVVEKLRAHLLEDPAFLEIANAQGIQTEKVNALVDLVAEKLRNDLNSQDVSLKVAGKGIKATDKEAETAAISLWSYRLYYKPSDDVVRRGDIIKIKDKDELFLVVTADCDLHRLWNKNCGHINLVPAFAVAKEAKLEKRFNFKKFTVGGLNNVGTSLLNPPDRLGGSILLPFVPLAGKITDFLLFPKEIISIEVPAPAGACDDISKIRECRLDYAAFGGYERVCAMSEPFLTPLIGALFGELAGHGVPDYPQVVRDVIKTRIVEALK